MYRLALIGLFVLVVVIRVLTARNLSGDDHWSLWTAATFLHGDRPFRDFVDVGAPLYWGMSALAQAAVGYRVIGEVLLGTLLIAAAAVLTFHLARQASRSVAIATLTTGLALLFLADIELYSYQKIFFYPLGMWLCWRYIDRPTMARTVALALGVAVAFGYRHDHGVYLGIGAAAALLATHVKEGARGLAIACARFGVVLLALLSPFLVLVQVTEGVVPYLRERVSLGQRMDSAARLSVWFETDASAPPGVFQVAPPPPARVQVEWRPGLTGEIRTELERRYSLTNGLPPYRQLYEYRLTDVSAETLTQILVAPEIEQLKGGIPATISIEWDRSLSARQRAALEEAYHLANPGSRSAGETGGSLTYDLLDVSQANLRALRREPFLAAASEVRLAPRGAADAPAAGRSIFIVWHETLTEGERHTLERTFGLEEAAPDRQRWEYALTDVTAGNIQALVEDPHVADTGLIDRERFRPLEEPWWTPLQRAYGPLRLQAVAPRYLHVTNAGVWLYYLSCALPLLVLIAIGRDALRGRRREGMPLEPQKMLTAAVLMTVVNFALLRRLGYFADHVAAASVLGAYIMARTIGPLRGDSVRARWAAAATIAVLLVSAGAALAWTRPAGVIRDTGLPRGVLAAWDKAVRMFTVYAASPPIDGYAPAGSTGDRGLLRYIYECTGPDDRIWVTSDLLTFPYYSERRVVGHLFWNRGFMTGEEYQRRTIEQLERDEVPLIVSQGESRPLEYLESYPLLHAYASARYTQRFEIPMDTRVFRVLVDGRRTPTGTYERFELPCFR